MNALLMIGLCISTFLYSLSVKYLVNQGMRTSDILFQVGLMGTVCSLASSFTAKQNIIPKNIKLQLFRFILAGAGLHLLTESYKGLSLSSLSLIHRFDVLLLIVLGPLVNVPSLLRERTLSLGVMILAVSGVLFWDKNSTSLGVFHAILGMTLITLGYYLISLGINKETFGTTILVPSLSLISFSLIQVNEFQFNLYALLAGVIMVVIYYFTIKLYKVYDLARAEFPTFLAALLIVLSDVLIFSKNLDLIYITSLVFLIIFSWMILFQFSTQRRIL